MDILVFSEKCVRAGTSYDTVLNRFSEADRNATLAHPHYEFNNLISNAATFAEVINKAFTWNKTPEGESYWVSISLGIPGKVGPHGEPLTACMTPIDTSECTCQNLFAFGHEATCNYKGE